MNEILALIEERQSKKAEADRLDDERKELDKKIEELAPEGTNAYGNFSVTKLDTTEDSFDSAKFKKENPDLVEKYTKQKPKHIFKIVELKGDAKK